MSLPEKFLSIKKGFTKNSGKREENEKIIER